MAYVHHNKWTKKSSTKGTKITKRNRLRRCLRIFGGGKAQDFEDKGKPAISYLVLFVPFVDGSFDFA